MIPNIITGSSGFIGSHLYDTLVADDKKVMPVDKDLGREYDLTIESNVKSLPETSILYHLAAFNGTKHFYDLPTEVLVNNTLPTIHLSARYRDLNTKFIFASTCEIFNGAIELNSSLVPADEHVPVAFIDVNKPRWSYSIPKALGENLIANAHARWNSIRFFNVYGPRQKDHFISEFVERAKNGVFEIYGNDTRSFCYVEDAVEMLVNIAESEKDGTYHVGNSEELSIKHVARIIMEIMGYSNRSLKIYSSPKGSASRRCPNVSKYEAHFGKFQFTKLEDGLEKTVRSYL